MNNKKIGLFIKTLREEKNLSQQELADKLYISRTSINKWERGTISVTSENILMLSQLFNVTTDEILAGERKNEDNEKEIEKIKYQIYDEKIKADKKSKISLFILITIILCILVFFVIYIKIEKNEILINNSEILWNIHDESLKNIKENLDEIAELNDSNEYTCLWSKLKDFNIDDEDYKTALNLLMQEIGICYQKNTNYWEYNNTIVKYRDKKVIDAFELTNLQNDIREDGCLPHINSFKNILFSKDPQRQKEIIEILDNELSDYSKIQNGYLKKNITYEELVELKVQEIIIVNNLSYQLKSMYYKYK